MLTSNARLTPDSAGEWCELIKDIVSMANSGGGVIVIGLDDVGIPSGADVRAVLDMDHATIIDKIRKYTALQFGDIEIHEAAKSGAKLAILEVSSVRVPIVFQNVGTYEVSPGKQKTAFSRGTIYFRHGAKSEPGTTDDIRKVIERQLEMIRSEWLDGVRKVIKAPPGAHVTVFTGEVRESDSPDAMPVRFVDDPNAPGYRIIDYDVTYPYRQKELVSVVNGMLPDGSDINSYDLLAVRRIYEVDKNAHFSHAPKFGSPQYSDEFAHWLIQQHKENSDFFFEVRERYYDLTHGDG